MDNDAIVLEDAKDAAFRLDVAYRKAIYRNDTDAILELKLQVDAAYDRYSLARLKLLEEGMIATDQDVIEMRRLKAEIDAAADTQALVEGAIRFAGFLAKFV